MKIDNAGEDVTLEVCQMYQELKINCIWNDGKDLILIEKRAFKRELENSGY